jgi:hypothetical protein
MQREILPKRALKKEAMMNRIFRMSLILGVLLIPTAVFAQEATAIDVDIDLKKIIAVLIMGVGVPLAVQVLKVVWPNAPSWMKMIAGPVIVPALGYLASLASGWLGFAIDFSDIIAVLMATGLGSSVAFTMGKKKAA